MDSALQFRSKPQSQLTDSNFRNDPDSIMIQHNMWIRGIFQLKPVKILIISTMQDPLPFILSYYHISYHQKYYNSGTHRTIKSFCIDSEGCVTVRETKENKLCQAARGKTIHEDKLYQAFTYLLYCFKRYKNYKAVILANHSV